MILYWALVWHKAENVVEKERERQKERRRPNRWKEHSAIVPEEVAQEQDLILIRLDLYGIRTVDQHLRGKQGNGSGRVRIHKTLPG